MGFISSRARYKLLGGAIAVSTALGMVSSMSSAQVVVEPEPPETIESIGSLTGKTPKFPAALFDTIVKDKAKAIVLGKAFFWDMQVGKHGVACASCHYNAGADTRTRNQLNFAFDNVFNPTRTGSGGTNYRVKLEDFPFHVLSNPEDRNSGVLFDTDDVMGASGVFKQRFDHLDSWEDKCIFEDPANTQWKDGNNHLVRQATGRNAPTVINAVFQYRTFWDGRANNNFNGMNPFGKRDTTKRILKLNSLGKPVPVTFSLDNAALASQAVGPPLNGVEMSCGGKLFEELGRVMLNRVPLEEQAVASDDSVLGPYRRLAPPNGLNISYKQLIKDAFYPQWWNAPTWKDEDGFTMMENNFSMYWGIAIMMYEATLISDQTPLDDYVNGNPVALSESQLRGLDIFLNKGKCIACHKGPDLTGAGMVLQKEAKEGGLVERMFMNDNKVAMYDNGFYNIGVRPTKEDLGVGGKDPFGNPLSFTKQFVNSLAGIPLKDKFKVNTCTFEVDPCIPKKKLSSTDRIAVDGAFKTSGLRNIELTGPYFHNGGQATLNQVVAFYNRGGDSRSVDPDGDTSGHGVNKSNLDPDITTLGLSSEEQNDLVRFMLSLTDERVRCEKAPFDHPSLIVHNGHFSSSWDGIKADDHDVFLPAVGKGGLPAGSCLKSFLDHVYE